MEIMLGWKFIFKIARVFKEKISLMVFCIMGKLSHKKINYLIA